MIVDLSKFEVILWDMDGVIVNSENFWPKKQPAWIEKNFPLFPQGKCTEFMGQSARGVFFILQKYYPDLDWGKFYKELEHLALTEIYPHAPIFSGVASALENFSTTHRQSISSSALKSWIDVVVQNNNLQHYFEKIISSEHVNGASKPAPDVFLHTAKLMNIDASKCLVLEDSPNGILAAKRAGMTVGAFLSSSNHHQNTSGADFHFTDFSELFSS